MSTATSVTVHTYTSAPAGFLVNSHMIETENGVIVIDTQFLVSEAQHVCKQIEALGKPLLAVFITHPHPDHFNGSSIVLENLENVPLIATQATLEGIRATEAEKRAAWKPTYGADYPNSTRLPDHIVVSGTQLSFDGVRLVLQDLGPGEASNESIVVWEDQQTLFTGDLVYHHVHPWLTEGRSLAWLAQLEEVLQRYPQIKVVYPGHGAKTNLQGLHEQARYITTLHQLIREHSSSPTLQATVKAAMLNSFPDYPLEMLLDTAIQAVIQELDLNNMY